MHPAHAAQVWLTHVCVLEHCAQAPPPLPQFWLVFPGWQVAPFRHPVVQVFPPVQLPPVQVCPPEHA